MSQPTFPHFPHHIQSHDEGGWQTSSRRLTISYHPGMLMPPFCPPRHVSVVLVSPSRPGPCRTYHGDGDVRRVWKHELDVLKLAPSAPRLGEGDPACRKFVPVSLSPRGARVGRTDSPSCAAGCPLRSPVSQCLTLPPVGAEGPNLSPNPCAMMTVAVCFFRAGTISAGLPAIFLRVRCVGNEGPGSGDEVD